MVAFLVHRPIATIMIGIAIVVLGLTSLQTIPISLMPDIDIPQITIRLDGGTMSARELEETVIKPLRVNLAQTPNLENIESETSNGKSLIKLRFIHGTSINYSYIEVNEKVDRFISRLPKDFERPLIVRASLSDIPALHLNLTLKDKKSINDQGVPTQEFINFNLFVETLVKKRLEQIPEVALVDISGLVEPQILIIPNENQMQSLGITNSDIEKAILAQDINIGSLVVKENQNQFHVFIQNELQNIHSIAEIYFQKNNRIFQLKDVATIKSRTKKRKGLVLYNDKDAIQMAITKRADSRMSDLKSSLSEVIQHLEKEYADVAFAVTRDQTKLLDFTIGNLGQSLIFGSLLAFLVLFIFLKNFKSSVLIIISIPTSLLGCFVVFHLLNLSINLVSLSGLIMGIGLMIDNSIIVIDNISQFRSRGYMLLTACVKGTHEVFRPLFSSVLSTCAVFLPLIFLSGEAGTIFYDQAISIATGLFVSLLVSITILPVIYHLIHQKKDASLSTCHQDKNVIYQKYYEIGLFKVFRQQRNTFLTFFSLLALVIALFFVLPKSQLPKLTQTEVLMRIDWNAPINAIENRNRTIEMMQIDSDQLVEYSALVGQQDFLFGESQNNTTNQSIVFFRTRNQHDMEELRQLTSQWLHHHYPKASIDFMDVDNAFNSLFPNTQAPLVAQMIPIGIFDNDKDLKFDALNSEINHQLNQNKKQFSTVWENQIVLKVDPLKLITYDVPKQELVNTLKTAFNENTIHQLYNDQYAIPIVIGGEAKTISQVLEQKFIKINDTTSIPINEIISQHQAKRVKTITAGKEGEYYPISFDIKAKEKNDIIQNIDNIVNQNPHFDVAYTGSLFKTKKLVNELFIVLIVTLLLIFLILSSHFESLILPWIILLEIPMAIFGSFLLLFLFGLGINLMSIIGIIVMSGIIINDSILKLDTIIRLKKQGYSDLYAIISAGRRRLKPILMTSMTTILAVLPLVFTPGLGGELQTPLAIGLIGGMIVGTLISLYWIPIGYYQLRVKNSKSQT
ncbi:MAG: efflux RND transporter permease subunit [Flavobacteriaceae bacterium]|nr:efflux RND transporter permease subunit [Flavobacteriaceae bacterium]MCY4266335.1 efflux RND transporter permease subunit [Flavobacteriaceae bacterium]